MDKYDTQLQYILEQLEIIKKKLPNGELEKLRITICDVLENNRYTTEQLKKLEIRLFDPENGIVVNINKNREELIRQKEEIKKIPKLAIDNYNFNTWKNSVSKGLWVLYGTSISLSAGFLVTILKLFLSN